MTAKRFTTQEKSNLEEILNDKIDIPLVPETFEKMLFEQAIKQLENAVNQNFGDSFWNYIRDGALGFHENEVEQITDAIASAANKLINIPFLDEQQEQFLFETLLSVISKALNFQNKLKDVKI